MVNFPQLKKAASAICNCVCFFVLQLLLKRNNTVVSIKNTNKHVYTFFGQKKLLNKMLWHNGIQKFTGGCWMSFNLFFREKKTKSQNNSNSSNSNQKPQDTGI